MHVIHLDRRPLLAVLLALVAALVLALAVAPSLSELEIGGSGAAPVTADTPRATHATHPAWVTDPLAPPALLRDAR